METYLTVEELAEYLKIAKQTIRRWVRKREIPFCKIHNVIRFRLSDIEKWVMKNDVIVVAGTNEDVSSELFDFADSDVSGAEK